MVEIAKVAELLKKVVNNAVVSPLGIPNVIGLSGFVFDIISNEEVSFDSDVTDHYVEDNTVIQDHVSLKPEIVTVRGFVGELTQLFPNRLLEVVSQVQRLAVLAIYQPTFAPESTQKNTSIVDKALSVVSAVELAQSAYDIFTNKNTAANKQQIAFNFFYSMWLSRQFFIVETPYKIFSDMIIQSVRIIQDETTNQMSDFAITFKKIRTVSTEFTIANVVNGRADAMIQDVVEKGLSQGQAVTGINLTAFFTG